MTQRKLTNVELTSLRPYSAWFHRVCELGLFADDDSHYLHVKKMIEHGTSDGKPWVEPELTDEDAKQRPLVMCRDAHDKRWQGPYVLVCKTNEKYGFAAALPDFSELTSWNYCRRATAEEIEDANAERR